MVKLCFIIMSDAFKRFTHRFGVMKINIDSVRAHERRCEHLTPLPPQTRVKMEPWCAKIAIQDQIELVTDLKMIWRIVV